MTKPTTDPIAAAWTAFREGYSGLMARDGVFDAAEQDNDPLLKQADRADEILADVPAGSIATATMKLRRLFFQRVREDWAAQLAFGNVTPEHVHNLELDDMFNQMLWGAIEDLDLANGTNEPDPLEASYAHYRAALRDYYQAEEDDPAAEKAFGAADAATSPTLFETEPTTLAGVEAIIRRILPMVEGARCVEQSLAFGDDEALYAAKDHEDVGPQGERLIVCLRALRKLRGEA